jgi:hypothetical protein
MWLQKFDPEKKYRHAEKGVLLNNRANSCHVQAHRHTFDEAMATAVAQFRIKNAAKQPKDGEEGPAEGEA